MLLVCDAWPKMQTLCATRQGGQAGGFSSNLSAMLLGCEVCPKHALATCPRCSCLQTWPKHALQTLCTKQQRGTSVHKTAGWTGCSFFKQLVRDASCLRSLPNACLASSLHKTAGRTGCSVLSSSLSAMLFVCETWPKHAFQTLCAKPQGGNSVHETAGRTGSRKFSSYE